LPFRPGRRKAEPGAVPAILLAYGPAPRERQTAGRRRQARAQGSVRGLSPEALALVLHGARPAAEPRHRVPELRRVGGRPTGDADDAADARGLLLCAAGLFLPAS